MLLIKKDKLAKAVPFVVSEKNITRTLLKHGYPFAGDVHRDTVVDHREKVFNIFFLFDPGTR